MNKLFLLILLVIGFSLNAQELPTEPENGFAFPIGSKFTIKLHPTDSVNFDFSIIKFEPFQEIVDTWENDKLFEEKGEEGTIEFYFCLGTNGETEEEKEKKPRGTRDDLRGDRDRTPRRGQNGAVEVHHERSVRGAGVHGTNRVRGGSTGSVGQRERLRRHPTRD